MGSYTRSCGHGRRASTSSGRHVKTSAASVVRMRTIRWNRCCPRTGGLPAPALVRALSRSCTSSRSGARCWVVADGLLGPTLTNRRQRSTRRAVGAATRQPCQCTRVRILQPGDTAPPHRPRGTESQEIYIPGRIQHQVMEWTCPDRADASGRGGDLSGREPTVALSRIKRASKTRMMPWALRQASRRSPPQRLRFYQYP
jgi:hypothetical protein